MPAMATSPRMPTTRIARTTQTQVLTLPAIGAPQQCPRVLNTHRIVSSLAERLRLACLAHRRPAIAALQGQASNLHAGPPLYPGLRVGARRPLQIFQGCGGPAESSPGLAPLVAPQLRFARDSRPPLLFEHRQAFRQQLVGPFRPARPEGGRPLLE